MARSAFVMRSGLLRLVLASLLALAASAPHVVASPRAAAAAVVAPIDPVLVQQMTVNPTRRLPVIVQMSPTLGHVVGANAKLADQAIALLRLNGVGEATLPLISGAAGLLDAAGITALSLVPGVAYISENAQVRTRADTSALGTAYPLAINADRVWASGGRGARHPSPVERHSGSKPGTARGSAGRSSVSPPNSATWVSVSVMPGLSTVSPISTSSK